MIPHFRNGFVTSVIFHCAVHNNNDSLCFLRFIIPHTALLHFTLSHNLIH
ncbi:hypothetical protein BMB171_C4394 [Bacillus thuringiensis BMB171]|nr:hypothetical protein BMB171_C4394 [Bacillus thuringiensis BMB171]